MASKLSNNKEELIRGFINLWLRDAQRYCANCGDQYVEPPEGCEAIRCCEKPCIGTNYQILGTFFQENKIIRETRANRFASDKAKNFRWKLSFPPRLMEAINDYCVNQLKEPFLRDDGEANDFANKFPQFKTCEVI
jgi:hypothetical protein